MESSLRERFVSRLKELKEHHVEGAAKERQLEKQLDELRATMKRVAGAIQVIEEELAKPGE